MSLGVAAVMVFAGLFAFANLASAASITNIKFSNGQTMIDGNGNTTTNAEFRVVVGAGEVVEQFQTDVLGDGLAPVCVSVGGELGLQQGTHFINRSVTFPPNTGTYSVDTQASGIFGGNRADDCVGDVVGTATFGSSLRTVASGVIIDPIPAPAPAPVPTEPSWFTSFKNYIEDKFKDLEKEAPVVGGPIPAPTTITPALRCSMVAAHENAPRNSYSPMGVQLQAAILLNNPFAIPALSAGSVVPMGYVGPQTLSALSAYKVQFGCI